MIFLRIGDIVPALDSITLADTVLKGGDSAILIEASPRDTLQLLAYARDRDISDTMTYGWSSGKVTRFILRNGYRARYVLPDSALNDTIIFKLKDGTYELTRKIYVLQANQPPIIDSLKKGTVRVKLSGTVFLDTATAGDTIKYQVFARDPEGGALTYQWTAADSTRFVSRSNSTVSYRCGPGASNDTVSVRVTDAKGASLLRRILLKVIAAVKP
jgi:hypothetical protein